MELSQRRRLLVGRLRRRKTRERESAVLVEGVRAVAEALDAGAEILFAVGAPRLDDAPEGASLRERLDAAGVERHTVEDDELEALSDTDHPQGILAVCREPTHGVEVVRSGGRYLVLDALQDPGNVGTLVRAACAFALDGVLALDGTVDPWSPKSVRASAGMAFRLPVVALRAAEALAGLEAAGVALLLAEAGGADVRETVAPQGWALVVGNEGAGPRPALLEARHSAVRVPMPGAAESLNAGVAGAILLYALTQETARD